MTTVKEIPAKLVAELRAKTGAGMMDCKSALQETGGDLEKAAENLNLKLPTLQRKIKKWGLQVE